MRLGHARFWNLLPVVLVLFAAIAPSSVFAQSESFYTPPSLTPWIEWVRQRNVELSCGVLQEQRVCVWPGRLSLRVSDKGATFQTSAALDYRGAASIPGGGEVWPLDVVVERGGSKQPAVLVDSDGRPEVMLEAGRVQISGRFAWDGMPETIRVPKETAVIDLEVDGKRVPSPKVGDDGELWLQQESEEEEAQEDTVRMHVSRLLQDGIPFRLTTAVELRVSGKARELVLGNVLPKGFVPVEVQSPLSYSVDGSWVLRVQVRPGVYELRIEAILGEPPASLSPPESAVEGWPSEEYWSFSGNEALRSLELGGAPAVEPSRTQIPEEWKQHPTYVLSPKDSLTFTEIRRGEREPLPNQLQLFRQIWLDLDGGGYTISDSMTGTMNGGWRLNMQPATKLTRATQNGEEQLVTLDPVKKLAGVEVRNTALQIQAVSRIDAGSSSLPAVGWDHDVSSLSMQLHVGPGWSLLEAVGAENDAPTWISSWRLWDIFFVCLMAIATAKLFGLAWGVVAFLGFVLSHGELGAPVYIWLNLLAGKALLDNLQDGKIRSVVRIYYVLALALLLTVLLPFAIDQIRLGLFPQLTPAFAPGELLALVLGPALVICCVASGIGFFVLLFQKQYRYAFLSLILSGALLLAAVFAIAVTSMGGGAAYRAEQFLPPPASAPQSPVMQQKSMAVRRGDSAMPEELLSDNVATDAEQGSGGAASVARKKLTEVDPLAVVQTGSAVPSWQWRTWSLSWNGPVVRDQTVTLYLISPRMNLVLAFVRVLLLMLLAIAFVNVRSLRMTFPRGAAAALLSVFLFAPVRASADDFPDQALLQDLEQRMMRDACTTDCTESNSLKLEVRGEQLVIDAAVSSNGLGAWPLPGPVTQFVPSAVTLDGAAVGEFYRTEDDGLAWIRIPKGSHRVNIQGSLASRNNVTFQFGIVPKHVEIVAPGWSVDGLNPTGSIQESLQLIREADTEMASGEGTTSSNDEPTLADWYVVERELDISLPWTVTTTVRRLGSTERAGIVRVPLLAGESINGEGAREENGSAVIAFARGQADASWTGAFAEKPSIEMHAVSGMPMSEVWRVRCSVMWRCGFEGVVPVRTAEDGEFRGVWQPFPGETLRVSVERPAGEAGTTQTVDRVVLSWRPGTGLLQASMQFDLRATKGGTQKVRLPSDATLEGVTVDGQARPISVEKGELSLPLVPGAHAFNVSWRQPWSLGLRNQMPSIDIGSDAANVELQVSVPERRWLLFVSGPKWGPAILFWGALIVVSLFSALLGWLRISPLPSWQWVLLGLGMATLHPAFLLLPAVCFSLLHFRRQWQFAERWKFNLFQVALILLCGVTLVVLYFSIYFGLIVEPDMGVSGYGSTNSELRWFIDRSGRSLPEPAFYSAPMWVWRMLMLSWSCWLVFVILRWMKWGWACLNESGFWRAKPLV